MIMAMTAEANAGTWASQPPQRVVSTHINLHGRLLPVREVVRARTPFYSLIRLVRPGCGSAPRVLVIAPLSGVRPQLLHDMLMGLLDDFDVHVLTWTDPTEIAAESGAFRLEDNITAVVDSLQVLGPGTHLIALCQSGLPALAAAAVLAASADDARPVSLTLLGAILDIRLNPSRIDLLILGHHPDWFEANVLSMVPEAFAGAGRSVYAASLQETMLLAYLGRHVIERGELFQKLMVDDGRDPKGHPFLEALLSPVAVPGEFFLDTIETVFHACTLATGHLRWRGLPVDPSTITEMGLFTIEGEQDDIAAPGQTEIAHSLCSSIRAADRNHLRQDGIGHFGLFHGHSWRTAILPAIRAFIREREAQGRIGIYC